MKKLLLGDSKNSTTFLHTDIKCSNYGANVSYCFRYRKKESLQKISVNVGTKSTQSLKTKTKRFTKKRYIGDIDTDDFSTPRKAKRNWNIAKGAYLKQRRQLANVRRCNQRLRQKVKCMTSLLKYLQQNNLMSENAEQVVQETVPESSKEIFTRLLMGPSKQKYEPKLRAFAMTLNFYSPKAYMYVRQKFNRSLPHPNTIAKWYRSVDGSPGFSQEALVAIKMKVADAKTQIICNMTLDEMSVRKQIEWDGRKFYGYVDVGSNLDSDTVPEAKEALVFMLVALNQSWKIPIGYFLLNGLSGVEKSNLVKQGLSFIHESGVIVSSLTFDASASNVSMAKSLGANFDDLHNLKTYFHHPITNDKVLIFFDACHMLKLIRNTVGHYKILKNSSGDNIEWRYLTSLVDLQLTEGLHAGNKLKKRHIEWTREKMKVKVAAQTMSKSVADALTYLNMDLKHPDFLNSQATSEFIINVNDVFDIFNSRHKFTKYKYKAAIFSGNEDLIFSRLESIKVYILGLTYGGKSVLMSGRKTGFLGFLINIESVTQLYHIYLKSNDPKLQFLSTYKLSQDHLEIFFSAIRSRGGHNNNPTAKQFENSYKRLLVHVEVKGADTGNAVALDMTQVLHCGSQIKLVNDDEDVTTLNSDEELELDFLNSDAWHLTTYSVDIINYISGFVGKTIYSKLKCTKCAALLKQQESFSLLQKRKQYGNLFVASKFLTEICQIAEKTARKRILF